MGDHPAACEDWQVGSALSELFPISKEGASTRKTPFSNNDFDRISSILEANGKDQWAKVVRTYACLRIARALQHLDMIIQKGANDISIPYSPHNLPSELLPAERSRFLEAQKFVLTDILDLERGTEGRHLHLTSRDESQFQTIGILGKGKFGRVEKVYSKVGQRQYALKLLGRKATFKNDQVSLMSFVKELAAAKKVSHHHVVEVVGSFTEQKFVGIVMGTIGECDLETFIEDPLDADRSSLVRTFFGCLASGLIAIHDASIRHKDIKPKNIIVKGATVMYTDFGLALDYSQTDKSTTGGRPAMFTLQFCAPEVADWQDRRTSSDVFSLGCVYLEMATRLNGESIDALRTHLTQGNEFRSSAYCKNIDQTKEWGALLTGRPEGRKVDKLPFKWVNACMEANANQRPTAHHLWELIDEDTSQVSFPFACSECTANHESLSTASEASSPKSPYSSINQPGESLYDTSISSVRSESSQGRPMFPDASPAPRASARQTGRFEPLSSSGEKETRKRETSISSREDPSPLGGSATATKSWRDSPRPDSVSRSTYIGPTTLLRYDSPSPIPPLAYQSAASSLHTPIPTTTGGSFTTLSDPALRTPPIYRRPYPNYVYPPSSQMPQGISPSPYYSPGMLDTLSRQYSVPMPLGSPSPYMPYSPYYQSYLQTLADGSYRPTYMPNVPGPNLRTSTLNLPSRLDVTTPRPGHPARAGSVPSTGRDSSKQYTGYYAPASAVGPEVNSDGFDSASGPHTESKLNKPIGANDSSTDPKLDPSARSFSTESPNSSKKDSTSQPVGIPLLASNKQQATPVVRLPTPEASAKLWSTLGSEKKPSLTPKVPPSKTPLGSDRTTRKEPTKPSTKTAAKTAAGEIDAEVKRAFQAFAKAEHTRHKQATNTAKASTKEQQLKDFRQFSKDFQLPQSMSKHSRNFWEQEQSSPPKQDRLEADKTAPQRLPAPKPLELQDGFVIGHLMDDFVTDYLIILGRIPKYSETSNWSMHQDAALLAAVETTQPMNWNAVARCLTETIGKGNFVYTRNECKSRFRRLQNIFADAGEKI